jgi:tetratricopeptide (TPR) repeat protein
MGSIGEALAHAGRLTSVRPDLALLQVEEILRAAPGLPQALLIKGRAQRLSGELDAARGTLSALFADQPRSAATALELGLTHYLTGDTPAAIAALRRATELKPDMAEGWTALADALRLAGDEAGADRASLAGVRASTSDPLLMKAALALSDNQLDVAEPILRDRLKQQPTDVAAIRMLAELAGRLGRNADAENLLRRAVELAPGFAPARFNLALVLHRRHKAEDALAELDRLLDADPDNPGYRNLLGAVLSRIGDHERAIAQFEKVLHGRSNNAAMWMNYGHALKTVGRQADSIAAYRRSIAIRAGLGEAWWSLANLKTVRFSADEIAAMERALDEEGTSPEDRFHLRFALGKALEDDGEWERSFHHYAEGNRLRRAALDYDADETSEQVARGRALFTAPFFAARAGQGAAAADPIFVLGMPRSGSTLVEQILASHSLVEGTRELPDIVALAHRLSGRKQRRDASAYPEALAALSADDLRALGEEYLAATRIHRHSDRPYFIDKMPNNWMHVGLIHLILPNATIIDTRRHPLGCGFSNFKQHFARGQPFSYALDEMGRYYADYVAAMAHVDAVLPGRVHRVLHEAMVDDTEAEVRRLLDACGLPFEPACLRFWETDRAVQTASSEQVRRPIFREGLDHWRHYEPWLGPLKAALGGLDATYPAVSR